MAGDYSVDVHRVSKSLARKSAQESRKSFAGGAEVEEEALIARGTGKLRTKQLSM